MVSTDNGQLESWRLWDKKTLHSASHARNRFVHHNRWTPWLRKVRLQCLWWSVAGNTYVGLHDFGAKQIHSLVPFAFGTATIELIHGMGVVTEVMISLFSSEYRASFTLAFSSTGTRWGAFWIGLTSFSILIWCSPSIIPTSLLKTSGNFFSNVSLVTVVISWVFRKTWITSGLS